MRLTHRHIRAMKRLKEIHDQGVVRCTAMFIGSLDAALRTLIEEGKS